MTPFLSFQMKKFKLNSKRKLKDEIKNITVNFLAL